MEKEEENLNEKTKYIIEIESIFDPQIDEFGILKEKIKLCKGEISFEDGIIFAPILIYKIKILNHI